MKCIMVNIAFCAGLLLCGLQCSTTPVETVSGGDDFPNMIADAGKIIHESISQSWENPAGADADPLSVVTNDIPLPKSDAALLPKKASLQKIGAAGTGLSYDATRGIFTYNKTWEDVLYEHADTIEFRVQGTDTQIVRVAADKVLRLNGQNREYYELTDADGDSLLVAASSSRQMARVYLRKWQVLGVSEISSVLLYAGNDNDFATDDDNTVITATYIRLKNEDTTYVALFTDADGDGAVTRTMSATDSGVVDVTVHADAKIAAAPLQKQDTYARMVVFADSTRNYAIRYKVINHFLTRTVFWNMVTSDGDSSFYPGDTVVVRRVTLPAAAADTLSNDTLEVTAVLGNAPADSTDDALIALYAHTLFTGTKQREFLVDYHTATPLLNGQEPRDGTLYCRVDDNEGHSIEVDATLVEGAIVATVHTSAGVVYHVVWNGDGVLTEHTIMENE